MIQQSCGFHQLTFQIAQLGFRFPSALHRDPFGVSMTGRPDGPTSAAIHPSTLIHGITALNSSLSPGWHIRTEILAPSKADSGECQAGRFAQVQTGEDRFAVGALTKGSLRARRTESGEIHGRVPSRMPRTRIGGRGVRRLGWPGLLRFTSSTGRLALPAPHTPVAVSPFVPVQAGASRNERIFPGTKQKAGDR